MLGRSSQTPSLNRPEFAYHPIQIQNPEHAYNRLEEVQNPELACSLIQTQNPEYASNPSQMQNNVDGNDK